MKKGILLVICLFFMAGCSDITSHSIDEILNDGIQSNTTLANVYRTGYKYYLPNGMKTIHSKDFNEIVYTEKYPFYLYVDVVSYFNRVKVDYEESEDYYYSSRLVHGDKFGYLQVKSLENDKYFVEIMYNYAKIEVIVAEKDIKGSLAYAMAILDSVTYNDTVLGSLMGDNVLNSNELEYNIFETAKSESNYLEIVEQYDQYKKEDEVPDTDFIK